MKLFSVKKPDSHPRCAVALDVRTGVCFLLWFGEDLSALSAPALPARGSYFFAAGLI